MRNSAIVLGLFYLALSSCSPNNVKQDNSLKPFFDAEKTEGCFGLFDNSLGDFTIYQLKAFRDSTYQPASTFDIITSLAGIQTGIVKDERAILVSDSLSEPIPVCPGATMKEAFRQPCTPWFSALAKRIGKDTLQQCLDTLGYAARNHKAVINKPDSFWLDNSVRVSADEQLGLVKKLYFNQLPFFARTQQIVAGMMLQEDNTNYKLSYITGSGQTAHGDAIAWVTGWIEENKHPYFFVVQLKSPGTRTDLPASGITILKKILKKYGFMEGKK